MPPEIEPLHINTDEYYIDVYGVELNLNDASRLQIRHENGADVVDGSAESAFKAYENDEYFGGTYEGIFITQQATGISFNSIDNPELKLGQNEYGGWIVLSPEFPENTNKTVKISDGDSFAGLTVRNASLHFQSDLLTDNDVRYYSIRGGFNLDGEITLTGYIGAIHEHDIYGWDYGDIYFHPDPEVMTDFLFPLGYGFNLKVHDNMALYSDTLGWFRIGSLLDEELDTSLIPQDNTVNHVEVTITDLRMEIWDIGYMTFGKIINIK